MGSDGTYQCSHTFIVCPRVDTLVSTADGEVLPVLRQSFHMYREYRVRRMRVEFSPMNSPRDVYSRNENANGASLNNMYPNYAGPEAYFMCTRFTGPAVDLEGVSSTTWTSTEWPRLTSFYAYDTHYRTGLGRKNMVHVKDMRRRRRPIVFNFRPTTCSIVSGLGALGVGPTLANNSVFYLPNGSTSQIMEQTAKYVPFPWLPTIIPDSGLSLWNYNLNHQLFGVAGAFRSDSWLPNSCPQWRCKISYKFEFRSKRVIQPFNSTAGVGQHTGFPLKLPILNLM